MVEWRPNRESSWVTFEWRGWCIFDVRFPIWWDTYPGDRILPPLEPFFGTKMTKPTSVNTETFSRFNLLPGQGEKQIAAMPFFERLLVVQSFLSINSEWPFFGSQFSNGQCENRYYFFNGSGFSELPLSHRINNDIIYLPTVVQVDLYDTLARSKIYQSCRILMGQYHALVLHMNIVNPYLKGLPLHLP